MTTPTCATCPAFRKLQEGLRPWGECRGGSPNRDWYWSKVNPGDWCMLHPERVGAMRSELSLAQVKTIALEAYKDLEQQLSEDVEREIREQEPDHAD